MSFEPREYLRHIAAEAAYLEHATAGVRCADFLEHPTLQCACVRRFEIIGEATKRLTFNCGRLIPRWRGARWRACGSG